MTTSDTVLPVPDLIGRPGASRRLTADFAAPADLSLPLADVDGALGFDGVLESVVDGVLVRGALTVPLSLSCARCLAPIRQTARVDVAELYLDAADVDDHDEIEAGYELDVDRIDLDALLRDAIAASVPAAPHCRPDCRGLCPTCGANRNEVHCDCAEDAADPRWAAMESLRGLPGARDPQR